MPWNETNPVNERLKFVTAAQRGSHPMTELCEQFGISRKTGYKILARYYRDGPDGLRDRSRAPISHPNQTTPELEAAILRVRKAHPTWGSKKILAILERERLSEELPARSTVDTVLKRAGVVSPERHRARRQPSAPPVVRAFAPNDAWSIDYKGWFRVGDGTRCDPLTVNDIFSRASLECRAMVSPKLEDVQYRLTRQVALARPELADPKLVPRVVIVRQPGVVEARGLAAEAAVGDAAHVHASRPVRRGGECLVFGARPELVDPELVLRRCGKCGERQDRPRRHPPERTRGQSPIREHASECHEKSS